MELPRLIALDLDGTLLDSSGGIPEENRRVLAHLSSRGVLVCLASGRMTACVSPTAARLGIDCPLIVYNGAMVRLRVVEGRRIIHHDPLPAEYAAEVIQFCHANRFHLNVYLDDRLFCPDDPSLRRFADLYCRQTGAVPHFVPDQRVFVGKRPTKLILIADPSDADESRTRDALSDMFSARFVGRVAVVRTNPEYCEFMSISANKGAALRVLAQAYGISREETMAFGDGDNDVELLREAGVGVAMAHASPAARQAADCVAQWDNDDAGVGKFLSRFL